MQIHVAASQPLQSPREPSSSTTIPLRRNLRQHGEAALCLAVLLADQASKAVQPPGAFVVNTGGAAILPAAVGDALWKSPTLGATCDRVDLALLLGALILTRKLPNSRRRAAGIAALAGLLSNLADRLGASSLFHAGLPRGSIDWIPVPLWPTARTNLADIVIALAALAFAYQPARRAIQAVRTHIDAMSSAAKRRHTCHRLCGRLPWRRHRQQGTGRGTTMTRARCKLALVSPPIVVLVMAGWTIC
jgi:hypothetical protein